MSDDTITAFLCIVCLIGGFGIGFLASNTTTQNDRTKAIQYGHAYYSITNGEFTWKTNCAVVEFSH